jgi:putative spermidine/putrescine transport system substrate-binding protein
MAVAIKLSKKVGNAMQKAAEEFSQSTCQIIRSPSRRAFLAAASGLAAVIAAPAVLRGGAALASSPLIVASFGGSWSKAMTEAFHKPFTAETGIQVVVVEGADLSKAKAQVETGNIEWDTVELSTGWLSAGIKQNMWEKIDTSIVDVSDTVEGTQNPYGIGHCTYSSGFAWNSERFASPKVPVTWADFWDVTKFPGRRGLLTRVTSNLEFALMADGVDPKKLYPLDIERAFKALDRIKPHVTNWVTAMPQTISLLQNNEVDFCSSAGGRVFTARKEGIPLDYSRDVALIETGKIAVLKGAKNRDAAMKHLSFVMRPDRQLHFAELTSYAPVKNAALSKLPAELKAVNPDPNAPMTAINDEFWWEPNLADLTKRFKEWQLI